VDQVYKLQIYLPPGYSDLSKSFPVLYLLDSDKSFGMAKDIVAWLIWSREIPEIIVVGIAYGAEHWWSRRSRDYTPTKDKLKLWGEWPLAGGAGNFMRFIEQELVPFVNERYRTVKNDRAIAGISFGGLFACYVLFHNPGLFRRYVIMSPAVLWNDNLVFEYESQFSAEHKALPVTVFSSIGEREDPSKLFHPWQEFVKVLEERGYSDLNLTTTVLEGETHVSGYPSALTRGIKTVFAMD
jgi:predicted alpha/beta superfamily hydrolase